MFKSVICRGMLYGPIGTAVPNGMTAIEVKAQITAIIGAAMKRGLYTWGGVRSSFNRNLTPSASGCSKPNGPTYVGPHRFCIWPTTFRSSQTVYATEVSNTNNTRTVLITDATMKTGRLSKFVP